MLQPCNEPLGELAGGALLVDRQREQLGRHRRGRGDRLHEGLNGRDDQQRAGMIPFIFPLVACSLASTLQAGTEPDALGVDFIAGRPLAGDRLERAEQFRRLAAEELEVVAGLVGLIEMGGHIEKRPIEAGLLVKSLR